jgi:hypothetical protein
VPCEAATGGGGGLQEVVRATGGQAPTAGSSGLLLRRGALLLHAVGAGPAPPPSLYQPPPLPSPPRSTSPPTSTSSFAEPLRGTPRIVPAVAEARRGGGRTSPDDSERRGGLEPGLGAVENLAKLTSNLIQEIVNTSISKIIFITIFVLSESVNMYII